MATGNAAATLSRADDWSSDFAAGTITIKDGATDLAVHALTGFTTTNAGDNATATANAIADDTILSTGTADTVELTSGALTYNLAIGADIILTTTSYVIGEPSQIASMIVTFNA